MLRKKGKKIKWSYLLREKEPIKLLWLVRKKGLVQLLLLSYYDLEALDSISPRAAFILSFFYPFYYPLFFLPIIDPCVFYVHWKKYFDL